MGRCSVHQRNVSEGAACALQAFADILASNETFAAPMDDTYKLLDLNPEDTTTLEQYLQVRTPSSMHDVTSIT